MAKDTWFSIDLPVLDAIVDYLEDSDPSLRPQLYDIAERTGIGEDDVVRAAKRMDGVYIELEHRFGPQRDLAVTAVSPEARMVTGQWPSAETMAARIIAGLEEAADREPAEETRGRLREAANVLGATVRDLSTNVLASVIAKQLGIG